MSYANRCGCAEGCPITEFTPEQREEIYQIIRAFNTYLPAAALEHKIRRIKAFESSTYFAWIGGYELGDAYYYRIHSPATFCEFDFHCGSESSLWPRARLHEY
jgi:hypothetical protein